jgi:Asp-tRNA(Asn)/Glu-tRNA(Gln) amidotransferase A subunit family amidase
MDTISGGKPPGNHLMHWIDKTALEQIDALRGREISASDLLAATLERAELMDSALNPFALKLYDRARAAANFADEQLTRGAGGALCGLPVTIKDSQWLADYPCANGSHTLRNFVPEQSSEAVRHLEQAGAVIFAKTTCPEFSLTGITESALYGRTANPWDEARTCGGSSGGAAVAVAAGLGSLALGGDGGGSIRIPAGFCGVVGFKPSFGAVPREPCFPSWKSIVSYGPIARTVADARLMYKVTRGDVAVPFEIEPGGLEKLSLVVSEDLGFAPVDEDVRRAFRRIVGLLESAGAHTVHDNPGLQSSVETWAVIASYDAAEHAKQANAYSCMGDVARGFLAFGGQFTPVDFDQAQAHRNTIRDAYAALFERTGASLIITPALGCEAFPHGTIHPLRVGDTAIEHPWLDWAGFLYDANLTGMPACAIPMGIGDEGMPLSLQIMGPVGSDDEVLRVAGSIEAMLGWQSGLSPRAATRAPNPDTAISNNQ